MAQGGSKRVYTCRVIAEDKAGRVAHTVEQLLSEIERLPAEVLYREPAPGEWPVMSTLAHFAELLPYWAHEAADLARSPGKSVGRTHDDPRRLGAIEQHGRDNLQDVVPSIRRGLAESLTTLRSIPSDAWAVVGQHPTRGTISVEQLVDAFLINHAQEHANQIHATLAALQSRQRAS